MSVAGFRVTDCRAAAPLSVWLLAVPGVAHGNDDEMMQSGPDRSTNSCASAYGHLDHASVESRTRQPRRETNDG